MAESERALEVGQQLKDAREEAGLSQAAAAQAFGVDVATISRWERGSRPIKPRDQTALLRLYEKTRGANAAIANSIDASGRELLLRSAVRRLRAVVEEIEELTLAPPPGDEFPSSAEYAEPFGEEPAQQQRPRRRRGKSA